MPLLEPQIEIESSQETGSCRGVTVPDTYGLSEGADGAQVIWYGASEQTFAAAGEFKIIGPYKATPDLALCSQKDKGGGARGCKFLAMGREGLTCERFSRLDAHLRHNDKMKTKRVPVMPFPDCMTEDPEETKGLFRRLNLRIQKQLFEEQVAEDVRSELKRKS